MRFLQYIIEQQEFQIYVDMDGVLTDFDASFKKVDGRPTTEVEKEGDPAFWEHVKKGGLEFWSEMPWMKSGKKLWNFVKPYKPIILSSPAEHSDSPKGKKIWIKRELGNVKLILKRANEKHEFSGENKILIDDLTKNIARWKSAGGIGILFKSAEQVIKELKKIIK